MHPALQKQIEGKISLSAEQEQLVNSCYKPRLAKKGEILLEKGSIARCLYFVVKGCLRVFLTKEDGSEWTRFLIFEDHFGTAFPSFQVCCSRPAKQPALQLADQLARSERRDERRA